MTIQLRTPRRLGVIAVPDFHLIQPNRGVEMLQRPVKTVLAYDVIAGDMRLAGVDASAYRNQPAQAINYFCDLLEASAQRKFRTRGVLDENCQSTPSQIEPLRRGRNGSRGSQQSLLAVAAAKRTGMQD